MSGTVHEPFVGYDVRGRNGSLGVVVDPEAVDVPVSPGAEELLVVGGRSSLLRLYIPMARVHTISRGAATLRVDLDVVDFTCRIADDGLVDLRLDR